MCQFYLKGIILIYLLNFPEQKYISNQGWAGYPAVPDYPAGFFILPDYPAGYLAYTAGNGHPASGIREEIPDPAQPYFKHESYLYNIDITMEGGGGKASSDYAHDQKTIHFLDERNLPPTAIRSSGRRNNLPFPISQSSFSRGVQELQFHPYKMIVRCVHTWFILVCNYHSKNTFFTS